MSAAVAGANRLDPAPMASGLWDQPRWYAACTFPRHEKRVLQHLTDRRIEGFLPLYEAVHAWKDRRKIVVLPLFPGYIFVKIPLRDRLAVLQLPGVSRFVSFPADRPVPVPDAQIESLQAGYEEGAQFTPHPFLKTGARVRVKHGCLAGAQGILVRRKQTFRFVLSIELLHRAVSVEVDASDVEPLR